MPHYYKHKGIKYQIVIKDKTDVGREEQLYNDFKYLERISEWVTIDNRVINGIKHKWLIQI